MISLYAKQWIDAHPESEHFNDTERWFKVILDSLNSEIAIDFEEIRAYLLQTKKWNIEFMNEFIINKERDYFLIKNFHDFYNNN